MRLHIPATLAAAFLFGSLTAASADQPARFMSVRAAGTEGRVGPSPQQRVAWIYNHPGLPLQVIGQDSTWVHVRDPDGDESWIAVQALDARRTVYVQRETPLRRTPNADGQIVAQLSAGVIGGVTQCAGDWRRVSVGGRIGWVENSALWGGACAGLGGPIRP